MKRSGLLGAFAIMIMAITAGCGGGGGGGVVPQAASTPSVSGTAATGAAIAGATVTLKDSAGNTRTATTASDGTFSIATGTLTPPFLLVVTSPSGTFYSVSADANTVATVNITPLTDLIVRSWYDVQGVTTDAAFADPALNVPPSPTAVAVVGSVVENAVQLWLNQAGVTSGSTNLISTPFSANSSGVDQVLDQSQISAGNIVISNGTVTQSSVLTAAAGSMKLVTVTSSATGSSSSVDGTVVPVLLAEQTALEGITAAFNNFAAIVNSRGSSLVAADLLPVLDPTGSWGGLTREQWAAMAAYVFKGKTISFSGIAIKSLGATTADTVFKLSESKGGLTSTSPNEFFFTKSGSTWLLSGDQRIAMVEVRAAKTHNQGFGPSGTSLAVEVNIDALRSAPTDTVLSSVVISGGPWAPTALTFGGQNSAPWDAIQVFESYSTYAIDPIGVSGGDSFTIAITPVISGITTTYTMTLNAITNEAISITSVKAGGIDVPGTDMTAAHLGSPLTLEWTLPETFAISQVKLGSVAYSGITKCDDMGEIVVLGINSRSGQITIPATCGGPTQFTDQAEIYLQVYGINGEMTTVYYQFHN